MIRKLSLLAAGAVLGAGVTTLTLEHRLPGFGSAVAAGVDTYRQLNLFARCVRANPLRLCRGT